MGKIFTSFLLSFAFVHASWAQKILKDEIINFTELAAYEKAHPEASKFCKTCPREVENDRWEGLIKPNRRLPKNANIKIGNFPQSPNQVTAVSRSPIQNYLGHTDPGSGIPPDTHGAVGLNHVITATNDFVKIHAKVGGAQISQVSVSTFTTTAGTCDPYMVFDPTAQRWIFSAINCSNASNNPMILMVSLTPDPTGSWRKITWISSGPAHFLDHPYVGFDANWIILSGRRFSGAFQGPSLYVINKADMYSGATITWGTNAQQIDKTPTDGDAPLPVTVYDPPFSSLGNPSPGTFYILQAWNGSSIRLSTVTGTLPNCTWNTTTPVFPSAGTNTWNNGNLGNFAEQMIETRKIATNDARISSGVMMNGKIWCSQTVALPATGSNRAAIQWWQLDGAAGANFGNVLQRGRIGGANPNEYRFFSSIAVNKDEDVLIGYTFSTNATRLNGAYSTRQVITPINTTDDDFIFKNGLERYYKDFGGARARWGDYSAASLDPTDASLWTIQEYASTPNGPVPPDNNSRYGVWWAQVAASNTPATPLISATTSALVTESCTPSNNAIDPNETVTVSFCLKNTGTGNTSNLVGTLLSTGGVGSPSAPQNYGVVPTGGVSVCKNFTFTPTGTCGGNLVATIQLQDGATNLGTITYNFTLGGVTATFTQNFDALTVPALPVGWVATNLIASGAQWVSSNSGTPIPIAASTPNSLFVDNAVILSDKVIETPSIPIVSAGAKLSFSNNYDAETGWDGGVLEISVNGAPYQDILAAGGSFNTGGYSGVLGASASTLANRSAWTGSSTGFITTNVNLPASAAGQNIKLRFRFASDDNTAGTGWRIDNVTISEPSCCVGCTNVSVVTHPTNNTVCAGSNATFTVTAGGSSPAYQWQVSTTGVVGPYTNLTNGVPYSGVTTSALLITGATAGMNNYYYRVVLNNACPSTATSNGASLTVTASSSPVITQQPANTPACNGANATFTVAATGATLSYQWQVSTNGGGLFTNIPGATGTSYTVTGVTPSMNNYQYLVIVTGGCPSTNTTTSNAAVLTVNSSNLAITGNPGSQTVCAGANASFTVTASGTGLTYQWQVSTNGGANYTDIPGANSNLLVLTGVTIGMNNNLYRVIVKGTGSCDPSAGIASAGALLTVQTAPVINTQPSPVTGCPGNSATFTVAASGTNLTYQWQSSATGCGGTFSNIPGAQSASYTIPSTTAGMNGTGYRVIVSGSCTPAQTSNCVLLNVGSGITINSQPVSTTVCAGANATFTVNATGGTLIYQWQVSTNGGSIFTDITGANTNTLTLTGVTAAMNNNQYNVLISNACTPAITSNNVTLTVQTSPAITTQPTAITSCTGSAATLTVVATGTNITYQWQSAAGGCGGVFTNIIGATGASYSPSTATAGTIGYKVVVSGVCTPSSVTSNCVTVTLGVTTVINTQPASVSACAGNNTSFSVTATGATSYQWQVSTNGGISFTDISGATTSTLGLTAVTTAMTGNQYRVLINGCPSTVTSNAATLTVQSAPAITTQPTDINTCATSATFTVVATGTGIQYQWQVSTDGGVTYANIPGANTPTLTLPNLTAVMANYKYRVIVSSAACVVSVTSNAVTAKVGVTPVIVLTAAPVTAFNPYVNGGVYTTVSPVGNYIYQWTRDGVVIPGLTSTSLTAANGLLLAFGTYQVKITDPVTGCFGLSNTITITDIAQGRTQLFISPNPTQGIIYISYYSSSTTAPQARQISIFDGKGDRVMVKGFSVSGNYGTMQMDMSKLSNGTYMVVLMDASGKRIVSSRIVKL